MTRLLRQLALPIVLALPAPPAGAGVDLLLSGRTDMQWDSNVFGSPENPNDDFALRISPRAELTEREGSFNWLLRYSPYYLYYVTEGQATGWSHDVLGSIEWRITPTLNATLEERWSQVDSLALFFSDPGAAEGVSATVPESDFRTRRVERNALNGALTWEPGVGRSVDLSFAYTTDDLGDEVATATQDREVMRASLRYLHRASTRHQLGGGIAVSESAVRGGNVLGERSESRTRFYNLFGSWQWTFDRTTQLSVTAGPAWVQGQEPEDPPQSLSGVNEFPIRLDEGELRFVDVSTCPTNDRGAFVPSPDCETIPVALRADEALEFGSRTVDVPLVDDIPQQTAGSLTYFADVTLAKRWERWTLFLAYRRQEASAFSSLGSSTVADEFTASLRWNPRPRWQVVFSGSFIRREQETDFLVSELEFSGTSVDLGCPPGFSVVGTVAPFCFRFPASVVTDRPVTLTNVATPSGFRTVERSSTLREDFWIGSVRVTYRFTRNFFANAFFTYRTNQQTGDVLAGPQNDRYLVSVGFEYRFDPIHL